MKCWLSGHLTKGLSEKQTGKTLIRLPGFSRLLWQENTVQNFRTYTVRTDPLQIKGNFSLIGQRSIEPCCNMVPVFPWVSRGVCSFRGSMIAPYFPHYIWSYMVSWWVGTALQKCGNIIL